MAVFGVGLCVPALIALVFPTVFQVFREDILYTVEGLLLAGAALFIGIRLLLSGQRYLTAAILYAAVCALLTVVREGWLLYRISASGFTITSVVLTLVTQFALLAFLIYIRSRATREA